MQGYAVRKKIAWFNPDSPEPYKISRTRIDNFLKCRRCFWLEERFGIKKPDSYPLTLNLAVDALLKKEFDIHRAKQVPHPLMRAYGIDAVPFKHAELDSWRHNFTGVRYLHPDTNLLVFGAVDDVWMAPHGELFVVDYKATSKADTPALEGSLGAQYKRQMEVYQWLLGKNGFTVSKTGYFVYANGKKDTEAFDGKLEFEITVLPCKGDIRWIEPTLVEIKACLSSDVISPKGTECEYCPYREAAGEALMRQESKGIKTKSNRKKIVKKHEEEPTTKKLF